MIIVCIRFITTNDKYIYHFDLRKVIVKKN